MHEPAPGIQVFLATPEALLGPQPMHDALRSLDEQDRSHIARFRFPRDRDLAAASRLLQRLAVAHCARIAPEAVTDLRFSSEPGARPVVLAPALAQAFFFSAANTRGMVACAVSATNNVGLDVEEIKEKLAPELVDHCCTADERAELWSLREEERRKAFFQLWTLKESYLKARGTGLQVSPHLIGFPGSGRSATPTLHADPTTEPHPAHWYFRTLDAGPGHAAALCIHGALEPPTVDVWRVQWIQGELKLFAQA
ncbi:4'-phosphopantetheinyl transferase family protein [Pseudoxanthomonas sacheonensis]|uniref:4'-phosphopantetheinyl transferase n=1 Tax=Pseudoxanthomonas sacheonensis TaxID=443615 RepID=A0ABU1RP29_9GAMM|nr:4'-phosphopantetheinyl transferase superfamily protein [Pseudoxanthomonas sacheonensis]MDR6840523.1 4'-phosphopantetheinyl transferase [Pseudoxanthomonas sacheonensis]